jgi:tetratricopeptide (TPR) repeat protein
VIFRDVMERFPTVPGGHNNLGFVQIALGRGNEALQSFLRANELGYVYPEISMANIATALFSQGNYANALGVFDSCLRQQIVRSTGILYGLSSGAPFPVALASAGDYVGLMALNAAWAAARAGESDRARSYLDEVRTSALAKGTDERGQQVTASITALDAILP